MSSDDGWNPTFRTRDGEELDRSDWSEWRNGPQTQEGSDTWVRIDLRPDTRKRLRDAKQEGESYDQLCNRLLELADQVADDQEGQR